jgi:1-acyl-sn-glycerol-3-phosphate acyltransferase
MEDNRHLARTRNKGVNPFVYWIVRGLLQPFFHIYFRMSRIGRDHIPAEGPVILAANHRSFIDPFVIGTMTRRPLYYVAKKELFGHRVLAWLLNALGAFPIDRGNADQDAMATARQILQRGDAVLIFPEGTRTRPGTLGAPKRGVGRLALETGAPVVPVAVIGTEDVRRGWRIRPHKVSIRAGAPLRFPKVEQPSVQLAGAVTERIWPCVMLQWEWLGGLPPIRRAAVIGAGARAADLAGALAAAGVEVDRAATRAAGADLELSRHDLVVLAVPPRALPEAVAAHGAQIPSRAGLLVASHGLVAPHGTVPSDFVAGRTAARAVAALGGPEQALIVASADAGFRRQLTDLLAKAGRYAEASTDPVGVELAGAATEAAALAAAAAAPAGPGAVGAAAGRVFAEVDAYARRRGAHAETFAGLAGTGDLVATVLGAGEASAHTAAGEPDALPLLAHALSSAGVDAPTVTGLARVVEGDVDAADWAATITAPPRRAKRFVRAA